jgi:hypothetical protein
VCVPGKASASARGNLAPEKGRPERKSLRSKCVRGRNASNGENRTCVVHRRTARTKARLVCRNWAQRLFPSEIGQSQSRQILAGTLHQEVRSQSRRRKKFQLENTFADGDRITRLDEKTAAASLGKALRIDLKNLISTGAVSPHRYSFGRSDACISASQRDRLQ